MDEFNEVVKKLYRNGYSEKTIIRMVKDIFESIRRERWAE